MKSNRIRDFIEYYQLFSEAQRALIQKANWTSHFESNLNCRRRNKIFIHRHRPMSGRRERREFIDKSFDWISDDSIKNTQRELHEFA